MFLPLWFTIINLIAVYAPGLLWLPGLPGEGASPWLIPCSPVLIVMFALWTDEPAVACAAFLALLAVVVALSMCFYRFRRAWLLLPCVLFFLSLIQGCMVARIISGIDAIGHS